MICLFDEVFGERNFINSLFVLDNLKGKANENFISNVGHTILIYARDKEILAESDGFNKIENIFGNKIDEKYTEEDNFGPYTLKSFFKILNELRKKCCKFIKIDAERVYLFGKNFIDKSNIKYDYYHTKKHTSYPDFIFKDKKGKVHIFEVKSVNKSSSYDIDDEFYNEKIKKHIFMPAR